MLFLLGVWLMKWFQSICPRWRISTNCTRRCARRQRLKGLHFGLTPFQHFNFIILGHKLTYKNYPWKPSNQRGVLSFVAIASTRTILKAQPISGLPPRLTGSKPRKPVIKAEKITGDSEALGIPLFAVPLDDQYSLDEKKIDGIETRMTVDIGVEVLGSHYQQSAQLISAFLSYQTFARLIILFDDKWDLTRR